MAIMNKMGDRVNQNGSEGNDWMNPNSIVRNTMRLRQKEFAVFTFIQDLYEGDMSYFHGIPGQSDSGRKFFRQEYCSRNEISENVLRNENCRYCASALQDERKRRYRYSYWVYVYNIYHTEQNPRLEQYSDAVYWEPVSFGNNQVFCERIMKPQYVSFSGQEWQSLKNDVEMEMFDAMVGGMFRRTNTLDNTGRNTYKIMESKVRGVTAIPIDDIYSMVELLPPIDEVVAGEVVEFDFGQFSSNEQPISGNDENAYDAVVGGV